MLPHWDPATLDSVVPFVIGCVGARRTGKSTAISHLLFQMSTRFELVVCFIGSAACNPTIEAMMERFWDPRFFFSQWDQHLSQNLKFGHGSGRISTRSKKRSQRQLGFSNRCIFATVWSWL